jgi:hypothetical protein
VSLSGISLFCEEAVVSALLLTGFSEEVIAAVSIIKIDCNIRTQQISSTEIRRISYIIFINFILL